MSDENQPIPEEATPVDEPVVEVKVDEPVVEVVPEVVPESEPEVVETPAEIQSPETEVEAPSGPAPEPVSAPAVEAEAEKAPERRTAHRGLDEPFAVRKLKDQAEIAVQERRRKKLDKIMTLFEKKREVVNDDVEKLLHVSDATATRYLSQLEKEGRIKQNGKTGRGVSYGRIN